MDLADCTIFNLLSLLSCPAGLSFNLPWKYKAGFLFTCMPIRLCLTVTLAEIWAAFTNLMAMVHVVAMEIATFRGCSKAFVLLNGCKGWQNTCGRHGTKDA